jgi:hypothetical protein
MRATRCLPARAIYKHVHVPFHLTFAPLSSHFQVGEVLDARYEVFAVDEPPGVSLSITQRQRHVSFPLIADWRGA